MVKEMIRGLVYTDEIEAIAGQIHLTKVYSRMRCDKDDIFDIIQTSDSLDYSVIAMRRILHLMK